MQNIADLNGYVALAQFAAIKGFTEVLGEMPIWSNAKIQADNLLKWATDDLPEDHGIKTVHFFIGRVFIPGTHHFYKGYACVQVTGNQTDGWTLRKVEITLHHHRMSEYSGANQFDISLPEGVPNMTWFSTKQSEVDDPSHSADRFIEPYHSRYVAPEPETV